MHVTQTLRSALQHHAERPMTIYGDRVRTVAESAERVARFAGALRSLGVLSDDRVGILALNSDRYHEYLLAVPWADAVVNPVNVRWSVAEIVRPAAAPRTAKYASWTSTTPRFPAERSARSSCAATTQ